MRFTATRETFIPAAATKVTDKRSDAVAYVYATAKGKPAALVFMGGRARPLWHRAYRDDAARARDVTRVFEDRRRAAAGEAERRAQAARPHGFEIGHVLVSSWGYDQTNISFYQVVRIVGRCMVEIRPIAQADASDGHEPWATGKAVPAFDAFSGEPMRRRVDGKHRTVRIDDCRTAHLWDGRPQSWTAYA